MSMSTSTTKIHGAKTGILAGLVRPDQTVIAERELNDKERKAWGRQVEKVKRQIGAANKLHDELVDLQAESLAAASRGIAGDLCSSTRSELAEAFLRFALMRGLSCKIAQAKKFYLADEVAAA